MSDKITVRTKYRDYLNVPQTSWKELRPYWPEIVSAIIEVILENDFNLTVVKKGNRSGFIAPGHFWKKFQENPQRYRLTAARDFIKKLKEKEKFTYAIKKFNANKGVDWLTAENIPTLGGYVYSFCFYLLDYLNGIKSSQKIQYV